jgi:hypothetical protein
VWIQALDQPLSTYSILVYDYNCIIALLASSRVRPCSKRRENKMHSAQLITVRYKMKPELKVCPEPSRVASLVTLLEPEVLTSSIMKGIY